MSLFESIKIYRADWKDIAFTKIAVFAGALLIAKIWNGILGLDWYWYLLICIIAAIKPMLNFFKAAKQA
jgi:hypothetical protein